MSGAHDHPEFETLSARLSAVQAELSAHGHPYAPADHTHGSEPPVEPPVEPPPVEPPTDLEPRTPFVIDGANGQTIKDFEVKMTSGRWAVQLRNCRNMVIENYRCLGGGIQVVGGDNVVIRSGLVSRNVHGSPEARDDESGVRFLGHTRGSLLGSVVAYGDCNVRAEASDQILLDGNFTYNPQGPRWRGQHFQTWTFSGKRSSNITIRNHYSLTDFARPGLAPDGSPLKVYQEDAMNFGQAQGVLLENVVNEMIGAEHGSPSGTGLIFESGSGITMRGVTTVGQANHGWSVSGGATVDLIEDTLSFYDGLSQPAGSGHTAGVVWQNSTATFGEGVRLYGTKPDGSPYGALWVSKPDSVVHNQSGAKYGTYESPEAQAELAALVRPPIPDVGFVLPGVG